MLLAVWCVAPQSTAGQGVPTQSAGSEEAERLNRQVTELYGKGRYAEAISLAERVLSLREKALGLEHPLVASSLNNLAKLYEMTGDLARAEPLYQKSLSILEKVLGPEHASVATSLNNLANLYREKGDFVRAESLFRRAVTVFEKALGPDDPKLAVSLNNLALLYENIGDAARAEPLYRRSLAIREKTLDPESPAIATSLNNLAGLYMGEGDPARAESLYARALSIYEKALGSQHPDVAIALNNLSTLYIGKGDYARAESLSLRALTIYEKSLGADHPEVAKTLGNLATLYEAQGDINRAVEFQSRSMEVRERSLALILATGSERQKLAYLATLSGETDATVSLHAHAAPADPQAALLSLTTILRRKGRALDAMSDQVTSLRRRLNPQDRALLDRLSATQSKLSTLEFGVAGRSEAEAYRAAAARLEAEVEQLQGEVSRRSAEFRARTQPVTVEQVRKAIPAGAALVEFFFYHPFDARAKVGASRFGLGRYVAYVLLPSGEMRWVELGDAGPIDAGIVRWRAALRDPSRRDVKELARALDERLMRPVRKLLGETRQVFISPDGALNLIPFGALVSEDNKYLVENYLISYLTSGRDLLRLQLVSDSKQPPLVLADPVFNSAQTASGRQGKATGEPGKRSAGMERLYFRPLPGTAGEAKALGSTLPGAKILTRRRATETALKTVFSPHVVHIATHGFFLPDRSQIATGGGLGLQLGGDESSTPARAENPLLRSGLALEGANGRQGMNGEDGILTALEASALDLWGTKLVVLSACETGVGEVKNGDGVYGLRRSLVLSGSESQVMSLWQVSDEATRDLMVKFYRRLAAGEGRTKALRQVQLEMLGSDKRARADGRRGLLGQQGKSQGDFSHPFYWAAFIQSGDWRPIGRWPV